MVASFRRTMVMIPLNSMVSSATMMETSAMKMYSEYSRPCVTPKEKLIGPLRTPRFHARKLTQASGSDHSFVFRSLGM